MSIPKSVVDLIEAEQKAQNGLFVPNMSEYLTKLSVHAELIVHQSGDSILGYVFFYCNDSARRFSYITLIGTSNQARGQGVGYWLIQQVLKVSRQRGFSSCKLEVLKSNKVALSLYHRVGFLDLEDRGDKYLMGISVS